MFHSITEIDNETNYNQEDRHISASLKFKNIYPLPQCMLSVGVCLISNMSINQGILKKNYS
jgi:hypothetical protein